MRVQVLLWAPESGLLLNTLVLCLTWTPHPELVYPWARRSPTTAYRAQDSSSPPSLMSEDGSTLMFWIVLRTRKSPTPIQNSTSTTTSPYRSHPNQRARNGIQQPSSITGKVLRLSHRDPGVTVERHPAAPLAGMGRSIPSCQGEINRVFQPPPELRQGGIPSRGRKQGCFQPCRPPGAGPVFQPRHVGEVHRLGNRAGESRR